MPGSPVGDAPEVGLAEAGFDRPSVEHAEAVVLFVDRARRLRPGLAVDESNLVAIAEIVQRLDGLPLAIELAAQPHPRAHAPNRSPRSLGRRFDVLTGGTSLTEPHHRTLEASIDWSFDLLEPAERSALRRLSVFSGGFTLDAVEAVVCDEAIEPRRCSTSSPAGGAIVGAGDPPARPGPELRFGMLETIRAYRRIGWRTPASRRPSATGTWPGRRSWLAGRSRA